MFAHPKSQTDVSVQPTTKPALSPGRLSSPLRCCGQAHLLEFVIFLVFSLVVFHFREVNLFALCSEGIRELLGYPPPAFLVDLALAVYLFSALVTFFVRTVKGRRLEQSWMHLGYRTVFYLFYSVSGTLEGHVGIVLAIGLFLYLLDQINLWVCSVNPEVASE